MAYDRKPGKDGKDKKVLRGNLKALTMHDAKAEIGRDDKEVELLYKQNELDMVKRDLEQAAGNENIVLELEQKQGQILGEIQQLEIEKADFEARIKNAKMKGELDQLAVLEDKLAGYEDGDIDGLSPGEAAKYHDMVAAKDELKESVDQAQAEIDDINDNKKAKEEEVKAADKLKKQVAAQAEFNRLQAQYDRLEKQIQQLEAAPADNKDQATIDALKQSLDIVKVQKDIEQQKMTE